MRHLEKGQKHVKLKEKKKKNKRKLQKFRCYSDTGLPNVNIAENCNEHEINGRLRG